MRVNVAARLESRSRAPWGHLRLVAAVYEQIEGKLTLGADDMGEQHVKNIPRAIHAYQLTIGQARPVAPPARATATNSTSHLPLIVGTLALVAVLGLGSAWWLYGRTEPPPARSRTAEAAAASPASAAVPAVTPAPAAAAPVALAPTSAPPPRTPAAVASRVYSAADVPFVADWRRGRLEEYGRAEGAKALAINARGWFAMAVRRIDSAAARRAALQECNELVAREVPVLREFDHCMLYAAGDDVVWSFLPPPMPPPPYIPAAKLSPPVSFDPAMAPLISEVARRNLTDRYMKAVKPRALVMGHGHLDWWSVSDTEADAIHRNLQICGHISGRPCVVYAVNEQVALGDLLQHHLGGAAADRCTRASRAMRSIAVLAHVAHAAVELQAVVDHLVDQLAAQRLDHRDFLHARRGPGRRAQAAWYTSCRAGLDLGGRASPGAGGSPACPTAWRRRPCAGDVLEGQPSACAPRPSPSRRSRCARSGSSS
jgi:hypothetical protein